MSEAANGSNQPQAPRKPRQVAIIGMDGATFDLIEPWANEGRLPNLARLMGEGNWGAMKSTEPPHSAPAWTSFATGVNPGKHGVYYFVAASRDKNRFRPVSSATIRALRLWQIASAYDRRVGVINVPMSYPPVPVNGYMIGDFFSPSDREAFDDPALYEEVVRECGGYCVEAVLKPDRHVFLQDMLDCIAQRGKVGSYLLESRQSDLFVLVFTLLDRSQHVFWADMEPDHPLNKRLSKSRTVIPDAIFQIHQQIDRQIGELLQRLDDDALVIVMSDHGFRGERRRMAVNKWLQEEGLIKARGGAAHLFAEFGIQLKRWGLQNQAAALLRKLIGTRRPESLYYRSVIWPETKIIYGPGQGFYINLQDRDYEGVVTQAEYEPLRDRIISAMKAMRDPETGLAIVGDVLRREELYDGDAFDWAPDVVPTKAEYFDDNGKRWGYGLSKFLGSPELYVNPRELSGTHSPDGVFIAWGKHIKNGKTEGLQIMDVAPTALYAMGLPVPKAMDGRVRLDLFDESYVGENPVEYGELDLALAGKFGQVLSDEHEAVVEQRLKDLGYL